MVYLRAGLATHVAFVHYVANPAHIYVFIFYFISSTRGVGIILIPTLNHSGRWVFGADVVQYQFHNS